MIELTLEQILELHTLVIKETGGSIGLRDLGRLEASIATQSQNVFGQELYPTILDKSAAFIRSIIADHPFVDGNKRTAMIAGLTLLNLNNVRFIFKPGEIEDYAVNIATDHLDIHSISNWLKTHIS